MSLIEALRGTLRDLLNSKKVVTALVTVIVTALAGFLLPIARKYGLPIDESTITEFVLGVLGIGGVTLVGQGLADHGKEAAKIDAANPALQGQPVMAQGLGDFLSGGGDLVISLGIQALLTQIKGPNKKGKIRSTAAEATKQMLLAYRDDPEYLRVVRPYLPSA